MTRLPVIVGFGGINPAGRSSGHHGYRRMVYDALDASKKASTIASLSALMGRSVTEKEALASTLIRKLENNLFDPNYYRAIDKLRFTEKGHPHFPSNSKRTNCLSTFLLRGRSRMLKAGW